MKNKILSEMAVSGPHGRTVALPSAEEKSNADPAPFAGTRFDWNDLTFFLNLARHRQLSAVGKRLKADSTTVGRRIRNLEAQLGAKLFTRTREGFVLTDAGQRLLIHAEGMEAKAREVEAAFGSGDEQLSGTVRVGTMEALGSLYLAERMALFHERHPDILIELVTASNWINLTKREADILISFPRPNGLRLTCEKIGEFQLRLYASHDYIARRGEPQDATELDHHDFIDYIGDLIQIPDVRWLSDVIRKPRVVFRSSSLVAQYHAVRAGIGIAMLPSFVAAHDPALLVVLDGRLSVKRDFWLSVHQDLQHTARIAEVSKFLKGIIQQDQAFLIGAAN